MSDTAERDDPGGPAAAERGWAMLVHDMRNALSGMLGNLALISADALSQADRARLQAVIHSARLLAGLVDAAGGIAQNEFPEPRSESQALRPMFEALVANWRPTAEQKGLSLRLDLSDDLPETIVTDALQIGRALGNLIGNAVKFTDTGGVTLRVRRAGGDFLCIEVEDSGPGLDAQAMAHLFEPFARGAEGPGRGEGLGLHIAKTRAEALGGQLEVSNIPGGGCLARLMLPLAPSGPSPVPPSGPSPVPPSGPSPVPPDSPAPATAGQPPLAGLTVLLAEDNATNQIVASQMLGALGARVVLASDGVEALELFERHEVDILLVDIEMPRMSGIEVIRAVRARPDARARTTVIALTAYAMREHRARIREAGADGIIAKPIMGIEELGRAISTLHAQRRGRDDSGAAARDGGVDPVVFGELCATIGPAAMIEFLEKVEGDLAEVGEGLRAGLEAGDLKLIGARSHVLISVAGAIGAREMQHLAEELNRQVHARARAELPGLVGRIHAGIGKLCAFVRREREALERDG